MLTARQARKQYYFGLAEWLDKCEALWKEKRLEKADRMTIYQRLDRYRGLTRQRRKQYTVVYPDVNRVMLASVLAGDGVLSGPGSQRRGEAPLMIESAMYYADTDSQDEAFYLAAWLNSPILDELLQSFRRKKQGGHPHVHKKVWEFPIPLYDPSSAEHRSMASLGEKCARVAAKITREVGAKGEKAGLKDLRNRIREELKDQLAEIGALAKESL